MIPYMEYGRLQRLISGGIAFAVDPAKNRTGLAWYCGGNRKGEGTIKAVSFPSWRLKHFVDDLIQVKKIDQSIIVVEGSPIVLANNGVSKFLSSSFAMLPDKRDIIYIPPYEWQKSLLIDCKGKTKKSARDFAEKTPEIHWRKSRSARWTIQKEDDASDAACLLYYALVYKELPDFILAKDTENNILGTMKP